MATGFMGDRQGLTKFVAYFTTLIAASLYCVAAGAVDVGLAGVMGSKALLMIDGGEPEAIAVGQSLSGVRLVSIQGDQAVIEIGGKKRPLRVGQHAVGSASADGSGKTILTADGQGHYFTTGTVNGVSVRFIVDTGATMISLGATDAKRIGIDASRGMKGLTNTANGQAVVSKVQLDTVRVGDITLHNVDAVVHQTEMPMALLGMSFLNRLEIQQDGTTMTLKKRF